MLAANRYGIFHKGNVMKLISLVFAGIVLALTVTIEASARSNEGVQSGVGVHSVADHRQNVRQQNVRHHRVQKRHYRSHR